MGVASAAKRGGDHRVDRDQQLDAVLLGLLQVVGRRGDLVVLAQGRPHLVSLGQEEGVGHTAADEEAVGLVQQVLDDAELVGDL